MNNNGKKWYPPLGNGVKAASEGLVPKEGALQTGEVVKAGANGTGTEEKGEKCDIADGVAVGAIGGAAVGAVAVNGTSDHTDAQQSLDNHQVQDGLSTSPNQDDGTGGIENGVGGMAVSPPPTASTAPGRPEGDIVFDHKPSKGEMEEARLSMDVKR